MKKNNQRSQQNKNIIKKNTSTISKNRNASLLPIIIAFCVPVLLYLQTVNFKFTHFDDGDIISKNITFLSNFKNLHQSFLTDAFIIKISPFYRPMQTLSYMMDIKLSGVHDTWMFHLSNILLLGLIACSLFLLLRKFSIPPKLSLYGTLVYCVHPLFVSSVAWIPARGDLQLTFFSLLSFLFFIEFLQKKKNLYLILNWAAFTIALFCKETAILLPLLFIIYFFTFSSEKHFEKKYIFLIMLYGISGILWFCLRSNAIRAFSYPSGQFGLAAVLSNLQAIPESLSMFFLPFGIAPIQGFSIIKTSAGLVIIALLLILFFKNKEKSKREKIFCFSWFIILMLPPMLYKHESIDYLDHRFLLPLIGILLLLLFLFPKKWLKKGEIKITWLMIVVFLFLCSFTFIKSQNYSDPMTFYDSAVSQNPKSAIAYYGRGNVKCDRSDYKGAIEDFNKAIVICPDNEQAYNNRGLAKANIGDQAGAIEDFDKAIAISPKDIEVYNNRGNVKNARKDFQGAVDDYTKAIAISPTYYQAYYNRGIIKVNLGDKPGAIEDFHKAIVICPNYAEAYNSMGAAIFTNGNIKEAMINYNKTIEINPNYLEAYLNRAIARYSLKDMTGAIGDCDKALELNPNSEEAMKIKAIVQQELQKNK